MSPRAVSVLFLCGLVANGVAVLTTEIQYKTQGGCTYEGHFIRQYAEFVPPYNPHDQLGCVRVLCKDHSEKLLEMAIHSCNPEYVNGRRVEMWPGRMYPDCCKKLN